VNKKLPARVGAGRSSRLNVLQEETRIREDMMNSDDFSTRGPLYQLHNGTEWDEREVLPGHLENAFWFEKPANDYCNDCVTHAFNYAFKHPILVKREQVHRLARERDRRGADFTMQRIMNGGYSLKMFNSFVVKEDKTYNFELYKQLTLWVELEDTVKAFFQTG
jgi:hypothetical protein